MASKLYEGHATGKSFRFVRACVRGCVRSIMESLRWDRFLLPSVVSWARVLHFDRITALNFDIGTYFPESWKRELSNQSLLFIQGYCDWHGSVPLDP